MHTMYAIDSNNTPSYHPLPFYNMGSKSAWVKKIYMD